MDWPGRAPAGALLSCVAKKVGKEATPASPVIRFANDSPALLAKLGIDEAAPELLLFDDEPLGSPLDNLAAALRERFEGLTHSHSLRPGDVVSWKPGLRNRRWPSYGKPAIVVETFATPVYDGETNSGSPSFREPLDVALGVFVEDGEHRGDFLVWHVDSRRLQPFTDGGC